tara:strand:+ start:2249 stop:2383 length:135 start_codon:yes stop_codon:yes gene_type:complete
MNQNTTPQPVQPAKKPNETGSISVEGHIRVFDPVTKEVLVEKRA